MQPPALLCVHVCPGAISCSPMNGGGGDFCWLNNWNKPKRVGWQFFCVSVRILKNSILMAEWVESLPQPLEPHDQKSEFAARYHYCYCWQRIQTLREAARPSNNNARKGLPVRRGNNRGSKRRKEKLRLSAWLKKITHTTLPVHWLVTTELTPSAKVARGYGTHPHTQPTIALTRGLIVLPRSKSHLFCIQHKRNHLLVFQIVGKQSTIV